MNFERVMAKLCRRSFHLTHPLLESIIKGLHGKFSSEYYIYILNLIHNGCAMRNEPLNVLRMS